MRTRTTRFARMMFVHDLHTEPLVRPHELMLEDLFGQMLYPAMPTHKKRRAACNSMCARVRETEDTYTVTASLPGVKAADVALDLKGSVLTLAAEQRKTSSGTTLKYHQTLNLPVDASADQATATHEDGLLTVTVPKAADKSIPISPITTDAEAEQPDEQPDAYVLSIAAPGVKAADVSIKVSKAGVLTASGETKKTARRSSSLHRKVRLPAGFDVDGASATHEDGLLTIVLPKAAEAEAAEDKTVRIPLVGAHGEAAAADKTEDKAVDAAADDEFEAV